MGVFLRTVRIAVVTTALALMIGAPEAYILSRMSHAWHGVFMLPYRDRSVFVPAFVPAFRGSGLGSVIRNVGVVEYLLGKTS